MAWMSPLVEATYEVMLTETEEEDEVEQVLDDGSDATSTTSPPQSTGTVPSSPQTNPPSTPRRPSNIPNSPRSPPASPSGALSAFNQLCSQRHLEAEWTELTLGQAHQPMFTMTVKSKLLFWIEVVLTALQSKVTLRYWGGEPRRRRELRSK
jgi:hypothetical protein